MKRRRTQLGLVVAGLVVPVLVAACGSGGARQPAEPANVERVAGSDGFRITLTPDAARRLDIRTAAVQPNGTETVIPYSAVFYSATGETWAYVNLKPLTFERRRIVVDRVSGDRAILSRGPGLGTAVATAGVPELHGIESGALAEGR